MTADPTNGLSPDLAIGPATDSTPELYRLEGLAKTYGERTVLDADRLILAQGATYCLLGHNGGGKTTLLKILAFLEAPSQGKMYFKGQLVTPKNLVANRAQAVWAPQFPVMFTGSLLYNAEYPLKVKGVSPAQKRRRAYELLDLVGLTHLAQAPAPRLSGGEAQRASLARALATGAEALLLDEPSANVDAKAREGLIKLLENLAKDQRLTLIVATHDQEIEDRLGERSVRLERGQILEKSEGRALGGTLSANGHEILLAVAAPGLEPLNGSFRVLALAEGQNCARLTLIDGERRKITVKLKDEASLSLARGELTLSKSLTVRRG
ncbi:MAG: ATP-binding cassette domain-containing protein [Deltaproteobacteria bacterium]|jgi:ABC-type Fe3+/spermidine/putrescine transport system ATPase subunit|nr:ATP-binding cassette domain-containing protein [Deltaproteobacteria bacterium]